MPLRMHRRITSPWLLSLVALLSVAVVTGLLHGVETMIRAQEGGAYVRPYGIGFVLPIAWMTLLGGRRFGLFTLLLSMFALDFFLLDPALSFLVTRPRDWAEVIFLIGVATLIIIGLDAMQRNAELLDEIQAAATGEMQAAAERQKAFLRDVLTSVTDGKMHLCDRREDLPVCGDSPDAHASVPITRESLRLLRQAACQAAVAQDFPVERQHDLATAVGEAAMNAVVHGGGGRGQVCVKPQGTIQVLVEDRGGGITLESLPQATLRRGHSTAGSLGHGFWLILQTTDRFWLYTGKDGTTVVLEQDRASAAQPAWA